MLLSLVVVALAAASVNGQAGCIPGASVNGAGRCECDQAGNPELCCYTPAIEKACRVAGDPQLESYTGQKIGLDFPCGTLVSATRKLGQCQVDVYTASKTIKYNTFYTSRTRIELGGGAIALDITHPDRLIYTQDGSGSTNVFLIPGNSKVYSTQFGSVRATLDIHGRIVVEACGTKIYVRIATDGDINQKTPGVCVVNDNSAPMVGDSMCAISENLRVANNDQYLTFAIKPMEQFYGDTGARKFITTHEMQVCLQFKGISSTCPAAQRQNAYKKCAFLLFHSTVRRCFSASAAPLMTYFNQCLLAYCSGQKVYCDLIQNQPMFKNCADSLTDCNTWPRFREVNQVVAGEGSGSNAQLGGEETNAASKATTQFSLGAGEILGGETAQTQKTTEGFDLGSGGF